MDNLYNAPSNFISPNPLTNANLYLFEEEKQLPLSDFKPDFNF